MALKSSKLKNSFFSLFFLQFKLQEIAGTNGLEQFAAKISHYGLYAFMTIMPASGIAMGYFGGKLKIVSLLSDCYFR